MGAESVALASNNYNPCLAQVKHYGTPSFSTFLSLANFPNT
jgi:hypothetical protein